MSTTTTRNALVKPAYSDAADIGVVNTNMDTIDASFAKCNWAATTNPGTGDDSGDGYSIGSLWFDTTNHALYIAETVGVGSATWREIYPQGSGAVTSTDAPTASDDTYAVGTLWVETDTDYAYICVDNTADNAVWKKFYKHAHSELLGSDTGDDHTQYLLAAGTRGLSADWDAGAHRITAETLTIDLADGGAAPMTVTSTTKVTNLNADKLDGLDSTGYIVQTLADAKGDIIVASADNTWTRLAVGSNTYVLTANSSATNGVEWAAAAGGGASFWTVVPGSPTAKSTTSFEITDADPTTNNYQYAFGRGTLVKWTESSGTTKKRAMITNASLATNTVTLNLGGESLTTANFDGGSLKYCLHKAEFIEWILPGSISANATDAARQIFAPMAFYPLMVDAYVKTAGTGATTNFDMKSGGTSIMAKSTTISIADGGTYNYDGTTYLGNVANDPTTAIAAHAKMTIDITGYGSTAAATEAYIKLWYLPRIYWFRS